MYRSDKIVVGQFLRVLPRFKIAPGTQLFDSAFDLGQENADSLYDSLQDDHDGGPAAGVASGFDPSGGNFAYQFGDTWDP